VGEDGWVLDSLGEQGGAWELFCKQYPLLQQPQYPFHGFFLNCFPFVSRWLLLGCF
jgi:hypothetical protein